MSTRLTRHPSALASRARSETLWATAPALPELAYDPGRGVVYHNDFNDYVGFTETQATSGTIVSGDVDGGSIVLDAGATTENQGIQAQLGTTGGESVLLGSDKLYFEVRLKHVDAATSVADMFVGLSITDTSIIGSGANTSTDHIGFELINEDLTLDFVSEEGGSRTTVSDVATLVADTYVNLGFYYDGAKITVYVDGVKNSTLVSTNIPDTAEMRLSLVCQASGTAAAAPTVEVDWVTYALVY